MAMQIDDYASYYKAIHEAYADHFSKPVSALRVLVDEGATVLLSSWVNGGEVTSYRVIARGMDGWRKHGDGKTLEAAIFDADAMDWYGPRSNDGMAPMAGEATPLVAPVASTQPVESKAQGVNLLEQARFSLLAASNYVDTLGGDSKGYRQFIARIDRFLEHGL